MDALGPVGSLEQSTACMGAQLQAFPNLEELRAIVIAAGSEPCVAREHDCSSGPAEQRATLSLSDERTQSYCNPGRLPETLGSAVEVELFTEGYFVPFHRDGIDGVSWIRRRGDVWRRIIAANGTGKQVTLDHFAATSEEAMLEHCFAQFEVLRTRFSGNIGYLDIAKAKNKYFSVLVLFEAKSAQVAESLDPSLSKIVHFLCCFDRSSDLTSSLERTMCDSVSPLKDDWEKGFPTYLFRDLISRSPNDDLAHCIDDRDDYFDFIVRLAGFVGDPSVTKELFDFKVQTEEEWAKDPEVPSWAEPW